MRLRAASTVVAIALLATHTPRTSAAPAESATRRMSFHNRLLLNRAVLAGLRSVEVLLLAAQPDAGTDRAARSAHVSTLVAKSGGRVHRSEPAIGYVRAEVPTDRLADLVASPAIAAYQIASLSRGAWYRDGPPLANAQMFRSYEVTPIVAGEPRNTHAELPTLSPEEARAPGFTAEEDAGVGEWMRQHPTYDGRGVTIALLENALPSFSDPTLRSAKSLDGGDVPKVAGILNAVDAAYADDTRVPLDHTVDAVKSWTKIGERTYVLPRPGSYRAGFFEVPGGAHVIHRFAVIEDRSTREVRIDAAGDGSFEDDPPLADVNERFEPRELTVSHPRRVRVSFVMGRGHEPHVVHIYPARGGHQTMTASVAAGSRTDAGLAYGVAPGARILFVRLASADAGLAKLAEGFIAAARHPAVDVISASLGLSLVPDTAGDFMGLLFQRLNAVYRKPIVNAAGNFGLMLGSVHSNGDALSAGGSLGPRTAAAITGGRALDSLIVHPMSAIGPGLDGSIKPDFLAPVERLAADLPWSAGIDALPRNDPTRRIPPGYQISCCTSASSPYAAGVVALLISAAKQNNVPYSAERLSSAMRFSARPVRGFQPHEQGNGVLDIAAAWRELTSATRQPRIVSTAPIVHPLAQYAAGGPAGQGLLEVQGWKAGMRGIREFTLRRESGAAGPVTYRVSWTGNDGTFTSSESVTLPLRETVPLPVSINIASAGAHSALLNLHDIRTRALAFRTQATVVATERIDPASRTVAVTGTVGFMRQNAHYLEVPAGTAAVAFELEVRRGVLRPTIVQAHGMASSYYMHVHPMDLHFSGPGRYQIVMPNPEPGTWTVRLSAGSTSFSRAENPGPRDDQDAEYSLTARLLGSSIQPSNSGDTRLAVDLVNTGARIGEPAVDVSAGALRSHKRPFLANGLPQVIDIQVPSGAATLSLDLRSETPNLATELYLYDCTTGECFSYDIAFPAASSHRMMVRQPTAGRWVAAVNPAPQPSAAGSFVLDEVITTGSPVRLRSTDARPPGSRWRELVNMPVADAAEGAAPVVFVELLDLALERQEREQPWTSDPRFVKQRDRPVAIGTAFYRR